MTTDQQLVLMPKTVPLKVRQAFEASMAKFSKGLPLATTILNRRATW